MEAEARGKADFVRTKKKLEQDINELEIALDTANRGRAESEKNVKKLQQQIVEIHQVITASLQLCLCGSLAQCALSLKRLSAGPGFNPQTRQNKLFQDYWRACFEVNFSDRQDGLTVSSIICDR